MSKRWKKPNVQANNLKSTCHLWPRMFRRKGFRFFGGWARLSQRKMRRNFDDVLRRSFLSMMGMCVRGSRSCSMTGVLLTPVGRCLPGTLCPSPGSSSTPLGRLSDPDRGESAPSVLLSSTSSSSMSSSSELSLLDSSCKKARGNEQRVFIFLFFEKTTFRFRM